MGTVWNWEFNFASLRGSNAVCHTGVHSESKDINEAFLPPKLPAQRIGNINREIDDGEERKP